MTKESKTSADLLGKKLLNPLLNSVGRPISGGQKEIKPGEPLYLLTTLPFNDAFPILTNLAKNPQKLEKAVQEFQADLIDFYSKQESITAPIWMLNEKDLARKKEELIKLETKANPSLTVCSTERFTTEKEILKFQINRVIPLDDQGNLIRDDRPSFRAERPGSPSLSQQLQEIKTAYFKNGKSGFLLEDTGFASGGSIKTIAEMLESVGITVTKIIGNVGWYPKAWNELQRFKPECLIWFDLGKGGWIENRDFLLLPQSGILVGETDKSTGETRLAKKYLDNDPQLPIGFTLPDITFEGRWFRIANGELINQIKELCLKNTLKILEVINPNLTLGDLAYYYNQNDDLFTLSVSFGNLNSQIQKLKPSTLFTDYLRQNFA
jgi:hypothetical protein